MNLFSLFAGPGIHVILHILWQAQVEPEHYGGLSALLFRPLIIGDLGSFRPTDGRFDAVRIKKIRLISTCV